MNNKVCPWCFQLTDATDSTQERESEELHTDCANLYDSCSRQADGHKWTDLP